MTETQQSETAAAAISADFARLRENPWNKARALDQAFIDSVKEKGILTPILARPVPADDLGRDLEIVCGARRYHASGEAGLFYIPTVVREMDDQEAQLCTLIENTHREDMTPWQEAQLIGDLLNRPDWDIAAAAAATGWSESMIRRRAKLLDLSPSWKKELELGGTGEYHAWTIAHFEYLAIFDEARQESLYKDLEYNGASLTLAQLRQEIADASETLKAAPFDLEDAALVPKAGSCAACPKRTGANMDLFGGGDSKVKDNDKCLDEDCFKKKLKAHTARKEAELREKHPDAIRVTTDFGKPGKDTLRPHEFETVKKGDKGAVKAISVSPSGTVAVSYVKVRKATPEKAAKDQAAEDKRNRLVRIDKLALEKLRAYILDEDRELEYTKDAGRVLNQYCLAMLESPMGGSEAEKRVIAYDTKPFTLDELWVAARQRMVEEIHSVTNWELENSEKRASALVGVKLCAWMVDADFGAMVKEAETDLEQLEQGGAESAPTSKASNPDDEEEEPFDGARPDDDGGTEMDDE